MKPGKEVRREKGEKRGSEGGGGERGSSCRRRLGKVKTKVGKERESGERGEEESRGEIGSGG